MPDDDDRWMLRCLLLASRSLGCTWPNPGVGCIIVRDDVCLGSGRHEVCGEEHAEVRALHDVRRRGHDPAGATAYVSLAPCTRVNRQGACCNALAAARIARVVAAIRDPNQEDAQLSLGAHRIAYRVGVLAELATQLHGGFLSRIQRGRPRVTGKWAMTIDGFLASSGGASAWISSPEALALSRRRRRAFDAILVGAGTARRDNPQLLAANPRRHGAQAGPLRVVVSQQAELRADSRLICSIAQAPLLMIHGAQIPEHRRGELRRQGLQVRAVDDAHDPAQVLRVLAELGINDLLVEGGATIHAAFLKAGLYDRLELYLGLTSLGGGLGVATGAGVASPALGAHWVLEEPARSCGSTIAMRLARQLA